MKKIIKIGSFTIFKISNWGRFFQSTLGYLWLPVPLLWFIYSGYFNRPISEVFGYLSKDGWCNSRIEGLGAHCFGDFQTPLIMLENGNAWANQFNSAYTPTALIPHLLTVAADHLGGRAFSLTLAMTIISISLFLPGIVTSINTSKPNKWIPLFFLGVGSLPFLISFDRGNSAALVVPILIWIVHAFYFQNLIQLSVAVLIASAIRPQFIFFALLLIFCRKFLLAVLTGISFVLITVFGFILWPGNFSQDISRWILNITSYNSYSSLSSGYPLNLSASRSVWNILSFFNTSSLQGENWSSRTQDFLEANPSLIGIVLLVMVTLISLFASKNTPPVIPLFVVLPLPMLVPGTAYSYYLNFVLVLAAIIFISPRYWFTKKIDSPAEFKQHGVLDDPKSSKIPTILGLLYVVTLVISLVPMPSLPLGLSIKQIHFEFNSGLFIPYIGVMWLITVVASCIYLVTLRASSK